MISANPPSQSVPTPPFKSNLVESALIEQSIVTLTKFTWTSVLGIALLLEEPDTVSYSLTDQPGIIGYFHWKHLVPLTYVMLLIYFVHRPEDLPNASVQTVTTNSLRKPRKPISQNPQIIQTSLVQTPAANHQMGWSKATGTPWSTCPVPTSPRNRCHAGFGSTLLFMLLKL